MKAQSLVLRMLVGSMVGCTGTKTASTVRASNYASAPNNVQVNLTDAPAADLKSVTVNIDHAELRVSHGQKDGRLIVAQGLGQVDLLTLQNGLTLPMDQLNLPADTTISEIRLVLKAQGNSVTKADGSICQLQTPSEQQTGIKILITGGITIENGYSYSLVTDFDAGQSVVMQGNGGCLLKPVLKLKSASRITQNDDSTANSGAVEEPLAGPGDSAQPSDGSGFESPIDTTTEPPVLTPSELM